MRPRQYIPVAAACLAIQFCAGVLYMWSVFAGPIHGEYGWDQAAVSFTASLMLLVFVGGMALGGGIADRIGPRLVSCAGTILFCLGWFLSSLLSSESIPWMIYLSYSGMSGIGAGFVYSCALSCMQRWLPNRKGLASGLSLSAFGFSVVFFTPVAELLLSRFGVAATFRVFALIFFVVMMPASLFIKYPAEVSSGSGGQDQENQRHASLMEAVFSLRFAEIAIATFTVTGAWNIVFPLIKIMAESDFRNVPPVMATATVMLTGICSSAGRLVAPAVSDRLGRPISIIILACLTICGCVTLIYAKGILFCVAVGLIAFAFGGPSGIFPAMVMEDFGSTNFGSIYGVEMFSLGLSSVFFSRVTHFLSGDGDYTKALLLGAGVCAITIIDMAHYWKKQGEGGGKSQCVAEAS